MGNALRWILTISWDLLVLGIRRSLNSGFATVQVYYFSVFGYLSQGLGFGGWSVREALIVLVSPDQ